jgi:hypothetical protein
MRPTSISALAAAALLALAACGNNENCKDACDKLVACGLTSSSFSCDDNCPEPNANCAACINDEACADILAVCGTAGTGLPCGASQIQPK